MTQEETRKIIEILRLNYPDNFKGKSDESAVGMVKIWYTVLKEYTYEEVQAAVLQHIANDTRGFFPPVGSINIRLVAMKSHDEFLPELEAWGMVHRAIRNSTYHSQEEFDKLPKIVQKTIGSPEALRNYAMDEDFNLSVAQSNFIRSYRNMVENEKEYRATPVQLRNLLGSTSQRMIGGGENV